MGMAKRVSFMSGKFSVEPTVYAPTMWCMQNLKPNRMIRKLAQAAFLLALAACEPALDWRDMRAESLGLAVSFPCRPHDAERLLSLAGTKVNMKMLVCQAGGMSFSLAGADLADPSLVGLGLQQLGAALAGKLQAASAAASKPIASALQVRGMTPNDHAREIHIAGKGPEGQSLHVHAAVFAYGTKVYQAVVMTPKADAAAFDLFLTSLAPL